MTDPKSLSTIELACELILADAYCRQTHAALTGAEAERYKAAVLELAERFAQSWISTGNVLSDFHGQPPAPQITKEEFEACLARIGEARRDSAHHVTFDFPTPGPLVREP